MSWLTRLRQIPADAARARAADARADVLLDQMRQIEWRLAMCRSTAVDVNIAHAIAFGALDDAGVEPCMSSASRYALRRKVA